MHLPPVPAALHTLRQHFRANGFDLRLVGGCVRDWLCGATTLHDIDLCTDANPDEQRALYLTYAVRHIATGLRHGTWTVVLDDVRYEISSLRGATSGSAGTTRDWAIDLARRDLTINALLCTFNGEVFDPHDGQADLMAGIVRFVGDPAARIREDPLRILRWFRFHARFSQSRFTLPDVITAEAISQCSDHLTRVSRERIWIEIGTLLQHRYGALGLLQIILYGVAPSIGLPVPGLDNPTVSFQRLEQAHHHTSDPVSLLAAYLGSKAHVQRLGEGWRWSSAACQQGLLIAGFIETGLGDPLATAKHQIAVAAVPPYWMAETLRVLGAPGLATAITAWGVLFPVCGADLLRHGLAPGPGIGETLARLRQAWAASDYTLTQAALLAIV